MMTFLQVLDELGVKVNAQRLFKEITSLSLENMFKSVGLDQDLLPTACERYKKIYQILSPVWAVLFSGVKPTLESLASRGLNLAIATNESRDNLDNLVSAFGIANLFQASCCADEVARPKPFPDMGNRLFKLLGTLPSRALMVGDSTFDMAMGKSLGMQTCAVGYGASPMDLLLTEKPDHIIDNFNELLSFTIGTGYGHPKKDPGFNYTWNQSNFFHPIFSSGT